VDDLARLLELEALRKLKARYFRHLDCKEWEAYGEVFTEDARMDIRAEVGEERGLIQGRPAIVAGVSASLAKARSVHHGHMAELEVIGDGSARGIWAMEDYVEWESDGARAGFRGYGHYHETYRKGPSDGLWRIAEMRLTRLRRDPLSS
jgi:hypothetical protein